MVLLSDTELGLSSHDRRDHAALFRVIVVQPVDQAVGVGVGGEDVELADGHVALWFGLRHVVAVHHREGRREHSP